jgi:hypothetical protein
MESKQMYGDKGYEIGSNPQKTQLDEHAMVALYDLMGQIGETEDYLFRLNSAYRTKHKKASSHAHASALDISSTSNEHRALLDFFFEDYEIAPNQGTKKFNAHDHIHTLTPHGKEFLKKHNMRILDERGRPGAAHFHIDFYNPGHENVDLNRTYKFYDGRKGSVKGAGGFNSVSYGNKWKTYKDNGYQDTQEYKNILASIEPDKVEDPHGHGFVYNIGEDSTFYNDTIPNRQNITHENDKLAEGFGEEFENIWYPGVDKNLLKAGIINTEKYNDFSSGLYGQDYSVLKDAGIYGGTLDEYKNDIEKQNEIFDNKINGVLNENSRSMEKAAKEIQNEYRNLNIPYTQTEIAGLINFMGEPNTKKFIEGTYRDGSSLGEMFPDLYGEDLESKSKTPYEFMKQFREVNEKYDESKSFEHYILNTLPPNIANKFLNKYSKEEIEKMEFNGDLEGKFHKKQNRLKNEYKRYLAGDTISNTMKHEFVKLGMIQADKKYIKNKSKPTANDVYEYIKYKNPNLTENQVVGIVANIEHESGFRPGVMGDSGTSGGLFQHHKSRLEKMKNFVGEDWKTNWQGQIDYAMTERSMEKYLKNDYKNPTYATGAFMRIFERPKDQSDENVLDRSQYLNKYDFDGDGKVIGRDDSYTSKL